MKTTGTKGMRMRATRPERCASVSGLEDRGTASIAAALMDCIFAVVPLYPAPEQALGNETAEAALDCSPSGISCGRNFLN